MITKTNRAEGPFKVNEFDYNNYYYAGRVDGGIYVWIHIQVVPCVAYVHLYVTKWGVRVLKEMRRDFELLKSMFRSVGIKRILGTHEIEGCAKWERFIGLLGFTQIISTVMPEGTPCKLAFMEV